MSFPSTHVIHWALHSQRLPRAKVSCQQHVYTTQHSSQCCHIRQFHQCSHGEAGERPGCHRCLQYLQVPASEGCLQQRWEELHGQVLQSRDGQGFVSQQALHCQSPECGWGLEAHPDGSSVSVKPSEVPALAKVEN